MGYEDVVPALSAAVSEAERHIEQPLGVAEVNTRALFTSGEGGLPPISREELIEQFGLADDEGNLLPGFEVRAYDDTGHIDIFYSGPDNEQYRAFFEKMRTYGTDLDAAEKSILE
jgi:hypothetical protein